jgi:hypothetical protein
MYIQNTVTYVLILDQKFVEVFSKKMHDDWKYSLLTVAIIARRI